MALSLGTSGVVFAATDAPLYEPAGRVHAFCHAVPGRWHLMSVMLSAAGSLRWFRDAIAPGAAFGDLAAAAGEVPAGSDGVLFLPYLSGERSPYPDPHARGAFTGLTLAHDRRHLTRAVMEGVAFGLRDGLDLMLAAGTPAPAQIRASGGGTASPVWVQILADVLGAEIATVDTTEGAAYGAALLAAVGAGWFPTVEAACDAAVHATAGRGSGSRRARLRGAARRLPGALPGPVAAVPAGVGRAAAGRRPALSRGARPAPARVIWPGFLPMMIIPRTSSLVTAFLSTVPTSLPWSITVIRSARSKTSWMSWLIRKIPMPSSLSWATSSRTCVGLGGPERRRRLVHDQDPGVEVDRPGDRDRLALAAGQRLHRRLEVLEPRVEPCR